MLAPVLHNLSTYSNIPWWASSLVEKPSGGISSIINVLMKLSANSLSYLC
jgi:hypothetical protein